MLTLNERGYLQARGLDVQLGLDKYPEGHQSGLVVILRDRRIISNGDVRLEACPGQFQAVPKQLEQGTEGEALWMRSAFPDPAKNRRGFNPVRYPDIEVQWRIKVQPLAQRESTQKGVHIQSFELSVELESPLPAHACPGAGFNIELFPGHYFGKGWYMEDAEGKRDSGSFPLQANGPVQYDANSRGFEDFGPDWPGAEQSPCLLEPLARGRRFAAAPDAPDRCFTVEALEGGDLELHDGRAWHNNGWFILRTALPPEQSGVVARWRFEARIEDHWLREPVIQVNQVGFHPDAPKRAVMEFDANDPRAASPALQLIRFGDDGSETVVYEGGTDFGSFLRYRYQVLDFDRIHDEGLYCVASGGVRSATFRIDRALHRRHLWQPVLDHFLPVQMCHMRVEDGYRVWHGACHLDDAIMAPVDTNHFDGYLQGPSTLCAHESGQKVPGLATGGWHDAGDFDLRIESQAGTVYGLALAQEYFHPDYDATSIDQEGKRVRLMLPDGVPDILQQIEHGLLSILGAWRSMGRLYRGIIEENLRDYVLLGDPVTMQTTRLVFTEDNPSRELETAAALACAARALRGWKEALAREALSCACELYARAAQRSEAHPGSKLAACAELFISLESNSDRLPLAKELLAVRLASEHFVWAGPTLARARKALASFVKDAGSSAGLADDFTAFDTAFMASARASAAELQSAAGQNPWGTPWRPHIWGAGWGIQALGVKCWILARELGEPFTLDIVQRSFDFILGCHPGSNRASYISGVGSESVTTAYGLNRADWSYIPGGSVSGTGLLGPDFPELLDWPYLWQQTEYVLGGGTSDWLFLALALHDLHSE